jgi:predicted MFS family arabinose efflux permease
VPFSVPLRAAAAAPRLVLAALSVAVFMVSLDARVVAPLLPTVARDFGVSMAQAGWMVSAYQLPYGLFQLAYGPLADRFGKVRVATAAMIVFAAGTALCGSGHALWVVVLFRALTGAAAAAVFPLTLAFIGDTVPYAERQSTIGALMASSSAAQAFSTSAGGLLATAVSWRTVFPVLGALAGASALWLLTLQRHAPAPAAPGGRARERGNARPRAAAILRAPQLLPLLGLVASEGFLFFGAFSYLSGLMEQALGLRVLTIGAILGLTGLSQLAASRLLRRWVRRHGERRLLAAGGGAMAASFLACAAPPSVIVVGLACVAMGVGFILCHSTLQTRATEAVPEARGTAVSLFAFSLFVGGGAGTVGIGYLCDAVGYRTSFAAVGAGLAVFTAVVVRVLGRPAPRAAGLPAAT